MKKAKLYTHLVQLLGLLLLAAIAAAAVLYAAGLYDISFIERPDNKTESAETAESSADEENTTSEPPVSDGLPRAYTAGTPVRLFSNGDGSDPEKHAEYLSAMLSEYPSGSASLNDGLLYGESAGLVRLSLSSFPDAFSFSSMKERTVKKTLENDQGLFTFSVGENDVPRPAVLPIGGYIIMESPDGFSLYDACGNLLLEDYDPLLFSVCEYFDTDGRLLFSDQTGALFRFSDGGFVPAASDRTAYKWELLADLPIYYRGDGTTSVYCENDLWGYLDKDGNRLTEPIYRRAFAHRDGLAIAYTDKTVLILNAALETVGEIPYETDDVFLTEAEVTVPLTFGKEYYGLNYFDHGMTVFRSRINLETYRVFYYTKVSDDARLYDSTGKRMSQPKGYEMLGYADGMRLLRQDKTGLCGYMDNDGNWAVDPAFTYARPFCQGLAAVGFQNGKKGLIDKDGNLVVPMVFDEISDVSHGTVAAYDAACGWVLFRLTEE